MSRGGIIALVLVLILVVGAGTVVLYAKTLGFSARAQPSRPERFIAHRLLDLSFPASAKTLTNPVPSTLEALADAHHQFKEHCAFCHGDDGLGHTETGRGLYPKPPNLRHESDMSDGVMFYIIRNGVRFTGMPGSDDPDVDVWKLVLFIRDLPNHPVEAQSAQERHE